MKKRLCTFVLFAAMVFLLLLTACSERTPAPTVISLEDVKGKAIGVVSGTAASVYAGAYGTVYEYSTADAMCADLAAGAIDCAIADDAAIPALLKRTKRITALDEPLISADFSIAAAKESRDLLEDINAALLALRGDGTLQALRDCFILGTPYEYIPRTDIPESAGSLRLAVPDNFPPYSQVDGEGNLYGLDIMLARAICDRLGVGLEPINTGRGEIEKAVWSARAEFGMGGLFAQDSGESLVDYSDSYVNCTLRILTRK